HTLGRVQRRLAENSLVREDPPDSLWMPPRASRPVDDRAHLRENVLEGDFLRNINESLQELGALNLTRRRPLAELAQELVPIGILRVEFPERILNLCIRYVGDSGSISQVRSRPREPPNKLERDRQTLMHVVQGGDLEFGEVETFPQHVHADNHSGFTTAKPLHSSPPLSHTK